MPPARGLRPRLVTLTTDIGWAYAAQMKGVLARSVEPGRVVDLAHDLPAHGVGEAAFLLRAMALAFPRGTVHVAVIDPGVGGRRAPVVLDLRDGSRLVGPDNGVLYPLAEALGLRAGYAIDPDRLERDRVGTRFEGRDLFAPAAARLALGVAPARLGPPHAPTRYRLPAPVRGPAGARGEVLHVDRFGNLISNVPSDWCPADRRTVSLRVGARRPSSRPRALSYEALGDGRLGVLGSSFGTLEVSVGRGRASDRLGVGVGARLELGWAPDGRSGQ